MFSNGVLEWTEVRRIWPKDIENRAARRIINGFELPGERRFVDVRICSDGRMDELRNILAQLPYVRTYSLAGSQMIGVKRRRPVVIIAHGCECGAVEYARNGDPDRRYPSFIACKHDPIENAGFQLAQAPEEFGSGVLYYDQDENEIRDIPEYDGPMVGWKLVILEELRRALKRRFTPDEREHRKHAQDPVAIVLTDFPIHPSGRPVFMVDIERRALNSAAIDSVQFALDCSLTDSPSFRHAASLIIALRATYDPPEGLLRLLREHQRFEGYINRGGHIYIVEVGESPSEKIVCQIA